MRVRLGGQQGARGVLGGRGGLDVESGAYGARQVAVADQDLAGRRVQLREQLAVLVVLVRRLHEGEDGRVLQLAREGVGDRALIGGCCGQAPLGQVVAVGEVRQQQGRVDGGDHAGQAETAGGDHLRHRLGLHGVPQLDDGERRAARLLDALQLRHQVLAQGAAGAVVDEGRLGGGARAIGVADRPYDGAGDGRGEVVVERDTAGHLDEQPVDGGPAGVGVQSADDHDGEHQPCPPYRRSKRSTRPAVSSTRAVPVWKGWLTSEISTSTTG